MWTPPEHVPAAAFSTCKTISFPRNAARLEHQGVTSFALLVGADGKLRQVEVIGSSCSAELDAAAKEMLWSCRYVSSRVCSEEVERWLQTDYVWSVENDDKRPSLLVQLLSAWATAGQVHAQYALYIALGLETGDAAPEKTVALAGLLLHSA